jgi:hypothetical protein
MQWQTKAEAKDKDKIERSSDTPEYMMARRPNHELAEVPRL